MCGLTGLLNIRSQADFPVEVQDVIRRMTESLLYRGPDAFGHLIAPPIAFGHRRLSILELSEAGAQPMRLGAAGPIITLKR